MEGFNLRKLRDLEVRKNYQMISNRFAALENLNENEGINWAWQNIKDNIKTLDKNSLCLYGLKNQSSWFDY
jgi:hypothetical protein